jgi:hypothetical protein
VTGKGERFHRITGSAASNFNIEEWDAAGLTYETLAICRSLDLAFAAFAVAVEEKPTGWFMIRNWTRVVKRYPEGDW